MKTNLIYGIHAVMQAIEAGKTMDKIFIQNGLKGDLVFELKNLIHERKLFINFVPREKIDRLTNGNHQGVAAFITEIEYDNIEELIPQIFERSEVPLLLVLEGITDVRNFGAIARSAYCAGVHAIIIPANGAAPINEDAIKTSAGALHHIAVSKVNNLKTTLNYLKECGISLLACTEKSKETVYDVDFNQPVAIVMGSEDKGISPGVLSLMDSKASIPIQGSIGSLNVSVAAGVVIFEALRQRAIKS
jgi:23S rRNA (guanosine2251-2'-O)-methyltransferase